MAPSRTHTPALRWAGRLLCGLVPALFIALLIYPALHSGEDENALQPPQAAQRPYDKFRAGKIELREYDKDALLIKISVEEIVHKKRRSRLFEYQNLKELYFSHAVFDIYPHQTFPAATHYGIPFDLLERCVHAVPGAGAVKPLESYLQETSDSDVDILSRILFYRFSLNIHYPAGDSLEVTAEKASIAGNFQSFVLAGEVKIILPHGEVLRAPQAVFSRGMDGILFPSGHMRQETYEQRKTFYRIVADGRLLRLSPAPDVRYGDPLEAKEADLYGRVLKKLPPYQRIMFGIPALQ